MSPGLGSGVPVGLLGLVVEGLELEGGVLDADREVLGHTALQLTQELRQMPVAKAALVDTM